MSKVLSGNGVPIADVFAGSPGTPIYIDLDTSIAYFLDDAGVVQQLSGSGSPGASTPGPAIFLQAEPGDDGAPGFPGPRGSDGTSGTTGAQGPVGPAVYLQAESGDEGPMGPQGLPGAQGAQGNAGNTGAQGPVGPAVFLEAEIGEEGPPGPQGPAGVQGAQGSAGTTGAQGPMGPAIFLEAEPGEDGLPGPIGATGPQGPAGGGGGGSATTVEVNLGSTAKWTGKFTITDAGISGTSKVLCWQAPGPYTSKGTRADEAELQPVSVMSVEPGSGSAVVKWQTPPMLTVDYRPSQDQGLLTNVLKDRGKMFVSPQIRLGKVRGNVKFSYTVFA